MGIGDDLQTGLTYVTDIITENPLASAAIAGGAGVAIGAGVTAAIKKSSTKKKKGSKKKTKKNKKKTTKKRNKKLKFGSKAYRKKYLGKRRRHKQKYPYTAGKRKDTSHRRIRFTKNNQPYIILPNGRARFIKRSSVRRARKLKGGNY